MVVVFLIWGISVLFPILGEPIYIPTNSLLGFPFLHILRNIRFFSRFLDVGILTDSDLHFWFWFSVTSDIEHLFMYFLAIWIFSLEKCLSSSSFHFKNSIACFYCWCSCYWGCMCSLYILDISPISTICCCCAVLSCVWLFATLWTIYSLPGSTIHGIFLARILEWVAIPFSRGSPRPRHWTQVSYIAGRFFPWATIWSANIFSHSIGCLFILFTVSFAVWKLFNLM